MKDLQAKMLSERIEITIVMEQRKAAFDAECCDPAVDDFSDSEPLDAELAIIQSALHSDVTADHGVDSKIRKMAFNSSEFLILNHALEHFAQD